MLERIKPIFLPNFFYYISYIRILHSQVQAGEDTRLQKTMDAIVRKTSMDVTLVVLSGEHYLQLQVSKPKMNVLEDNLRNLTEDKDEFTTITHNSFTKN